MDRWPGLAARRRRRCRPLGAGKKDSSSDRKNKRKLISNRKRKEQKDSVRRTLTLGFEAGRTYPPFLHRRLLAMPGRRIAGAQHVEPPLAAETPGRMCVDANARRRQRQARWRRAHPPVSARTGEQAAAAPPCPPPRPPWPLTPSLGPPPPSWREKGEGKKWPRVSGGGPVAGLFCSRGEHGRPSDQDPTARERLDPRGPGCGP